MTTIEELIQLLVDKKIISKNEQEDLLAIPETPSPPEATVMVELNDQYAQHLEEKRQREEQEANDPTNQLVGIDVSELRPTKEKKLPKAKQTVS